MSESTPPSSPAPIPSEPTPEPIPGVFRDGLDLVVPRGADISRFCYCCGRPSAGKPIVKFLRSARKSTGMGKAVRRGTPLLLDLLILILGTISVLHHFVSDSGPAARRKVTFGLCAAHRRKRLFLKWALVLAFPLGLAMFIWAIIQPSPTVGARAVIEPLCAIFGVGFIVVGCFGPMIVPGPRLDKEGPDHLWLSGSGDALRHAQKFLPATPSK